jgi:hypothetical protein
MLPPAEEQKIKNIAMTVGGKNLVINLLDSINF